MRLIVLASAGLLCAATIPAPAEEGILTGSWCGKDDAAIWIARGEAVLGEHSFCRWDPEFSDGLSYSGTLHCRTTQERHDESVEHPLPIELTMDARGIMTMSYPNGGAPEAWRRCT